MPRIRWIEDGEAEGPVAEIYARWKAQNPGREEMPHILKAMSLRPDLLENIIRLIYPLHFEDGFLDRRVKESIATYVSALNQCPY